MLIQMIEGSETQNNDVRWHKTIHTKKSYSKKKYVDPHPEAIPLYELIFPNIYNTRAAEPR